MNNAIAIGNKTKVERRADERHSFRADMLFSYFNKQHAYRAQTLNLSPSGMCFQSGSALEAGATIYIRMQKAYPNECSNALCGDFRSVAVAEVKWCQERPGAKTFPYSVGVRYFQPYC